MLGVDEEVIPKHYRMTERVGPDRIVEYDLYYVTREAELEHYRAWRRRQKAVGIDIETDGRSADGLNFRSKKIATLQIGNPVCDEPRAYVFCVRSLPHAVMRALVADVVEDPNLMKLGQNLGFEMQFLGFKYGVRFQKSACCQLAELVLRAGLFPIKRADNDEGPNRAAYGLTNMKRLAKRHLAIEIDKTDRYRLDFWSTAAGELCEGALRYAAGDVVYPFYIAQSQKTEIYARGLKDVIDIEFALLPILTDMHMHGIGIDQDAWLTLYQEACVKRDMAKHQLDELFRGQNQQLDAFPGKNRPTIETRVAKNVYISREINYNAPQQVQRAIRRFCKAQAWPVEVIIDMDRLNELKYKFGQDWLIKRQEGELQRAEREERVPRTFTVEDIPDWIIPRERFVVLTKLEGDQLRLAKIRKQLPRNLVETYLEYKENAKAAGTSGEAFLENVRADTGRIHVLFHQAITSTGRLSSEPNLQNIPRDPRYRACFVARKGYKFIIRDYSQIEPRLSAETSGDHTYVQCFLNNADIYCSVGSAMSEHEVTKDQKALRQGFKSIVLGTAYNMGGPKLCDDLTLKLESFIESGEIELPTIPYAWDQLTRYFQACPGIKTFQNKCIAEADPEKSTRSRVWDRFKEEPVTYVTGLCGRKRFFASDAKNVYTEAPNGPIQGCSATITKLAMVLFDAACRDQGIEMHFVNSVHDELVAEVPEADAEAASLLLEQCMIAAGERYIKTVPVKAEAPQGNGVFDCWYKEA